MDNKGVAVIEYLIALAIIASLILTFSTRKYVFDEHVKTINQKNDSSSVAYTTMNYMKKFNSGAIMTALDTNDFLVINSNNCGNYYSASLCPRAFTQLLNDNLFDSANLNAYVFRDDQIVNILSSTAPDKVKLEATRLIETPSIIMVYSIIYVEYGRVKDTYMSVIHYE